MQRKGNRIEVYFSWVFAGTAGLMLNVTFGTFEYNRLIFPIKIDIPTVIKPRA